jgi:AmiR/NasT family two-component response regulator
MRELAKQACFEIRELRRRNELLEAQMGVVEIFAAALGLKKGAQTMSPDIVWALERELEKEDSLRQPT